MNRSDPDRKLSVIEPTSGWRFVDLKELWWYRDLFYFMVRRDLKVRYQQTVLGMAWAVLQPFFSMVVFTLFFGKLAKVPNDGIPYPLFYFSGLVTWGYFAGVLQTSSASLLGASYLLNKVYFPRIILPLVPAVVRLVDFAIALAILGAMMAFYRTPPGPGLLLFPVLLLAMMMCATGAGMWLTALGIRYRDVTYVLGFIVQVWMFASPVVYPYSLIPDRFKLLYALNPMTGVIEGFRSALVGSGTVDPLLLGLSVAISTALFVTGILYFMSVERLFSDVA